MTWYRVLFEFSGVYVADPTLGWTGAFATRNVEAHDEAEAISHAMHLFGDEPKAWSLEACEPLKIEAVSIRTLSKPAAFGAGYSFHDGIGDAREAALRIERQVFDQDPKSSSLLSRLWRRITIP